jgi:hypothetical protein
MCCAYFANGFIRLCYCSLTPEAASLFLLKLQSKSNILIYVQLDAMLHSLFYLETALYVLGGNNTHYQERTQLYLQHLLFVTPLLLPAAIAADSSNGVTNTRYPRYSCLRS